MMTVTKRSLVCAFVQNCWLGVPALVSSSAVGTVVYHNSSFPSLSLRADLGIRYFTVLPEETNDNEGSHNQSLGEQARENVRQKHYIEMHLPDLIQQNRISYEMGVKIKDGTLPLFMAYDLVKNKVAAAETNSHRRKENLTQVIERTAVSNIRKPESLQDNLPKESIKYRQTSLHEISRFQHVPVTTGDQGLVDKISASGGTEVDADRQQKSEARKKTISSRDSQKTSSENTTTDITPDSPNHSVIVDTPAKNPQKILRSDDPSQIYLRFCLEDPKTVDDVYRATLNATVSFPHDRRPKIQQFFHFGQTQNRGYVPHEQDNVLVQTIHTATSNKDWIEYPVNLEEIMKASCIALCGQNWSVFNGNVIYFHQNIVGKEDQFISRMQTRIPSTPFGDVRLSASLDPHCVYPFIKGFLDGASAISGSPKAPSTVKLNIFTGKMPPKKTDQFLKNEKQPDIYQQFLNIEPQHLTFLTRQALAALFHAYSTNKKGDDSLTVKQSIHITEKSMK